MRARLVIVAAIIVALPTAAGVVAPAAGAATIHLAQKQKPAQPSAKPSPSPTQQAAGPPWTYQMSKISLLLLALMLLAVAATYYRLVFRRQRGEV